MLDEKNESRRTVDILRGIANSGYSGALEKVKPYLSHDKPKLRSAALEAMRLFEHPTVDGIIATHLTQQGEQSAKVRITAIESAKIRTP